MNTTLDSQGRIELGIGIQQQLGIRPGDEVILETTDEMCVIRPCHRSAGLMLEGNVLVHYGRVTNPADVELLNLRDERLQQLVEGSPK